MPCEHSPVTIFPNAFTYIAINGEQVMTLGAVSLVAHTSGVLPIDRGGTNATTPEQARTNLGLGSAATSDASAFATASQGALADTAMQPGDDAAGLGSGASIPAGHALLADGAGGADWGAQAALPSATQAEMAAGTEAGLRAMSPLLARQGEDARFAAPPVIGSTTPNRGDFTEVRLNNNADPVNFERLSLNWNTNRAIIETTFGGAGVARDIAIRVNNADRIDIRDALPSRIFGTPGIDSVTLGVELLAAGGWTVGSGWTQSPNGTFTHSSGTATLTHNAAIVAASRYLCSWTITGRTVGSVTIGFGTESITGVTASGAWGPTAISTAGFTITPTTDFNGTITPSLAEITKDASPLLVMQNSNLTNSSQIRSPPAPGSIGYGNNALMSAVSVAIRNTAVGSVALRFCTTGTDNSAFGSNALGYLTTGSFNVGVGQAGFTTNSAAPARRLTNGVFIGYDARVLATDDTNSIVIGSGARGRGSNTTVIGADTTTLTRLQGTVETPLDFESITNGKGVLLRSPNGTRYRISVNDAGAVIATAAP